MSGLPEAQEGAPQNAVPTSRSFTRSPSLPGTQLCDEQKPSCGACSRLLLTCEWEDKMQAALERRRKRIERLQQKERIKQEEEEEKSRELQAVAGPAGNLDPMLGVAAWPYGAAAMGWPPAMIPSWPSAGADFGILRAPPGLSTLERLLTPTLRSLQPRTAVAHAPATDLLRLTSRSSRVYCMDAVSRLVRADGVRACGDERGDGLARQSPSERCGVPPAARPCARNPPSDRPVRLRSSRWPTAGHTARCREQEHRIEPAIRPLRPSPVAFTRRTPLLSRAHSASPRQHRPPFAHSSVEFARHADGRDQGGRDRRPGSCRHLQRCAGAGHASSGTTSSCRRQPSRDFPRIRRLCFHAVVPSVALSVALVHVFRSEY